MRFLCKLFIYWGKCHNEGFVKVLLHLSLVVRKPAFCICENKDADQLRSNREADQHLCFRYTDKTIPLLPKYEISNLKPSSVVVQPSLCWTWSETPKTGFHTTRLISDGKNAGIMLYTLCTPNFNFVQSVFHYKTTLDGSCVCLLLTPQVHRPSLLTTFFSGFHLRVYVYTVEPET